MRVFLKTFYALIGLQLVLCIDKKFSTFLVFKKYLYTVHPIVTLVDNGVKSLIQHDKLDPNGMLDVKPNQKVVLHCTGYNNLLSIKHEDYLDIEKDDYPVHIQTDFKLPIGKFINKNFNQIRCLSPSLVSNEKSDEKCGPFNRGTIVPMGFRTSKTCPFLTLYTICFDGIDNMSAYYTTHQLLGSELLFPENRKLRNLPITRKIRLLNVSNASSPYFAESQSFLFKRLFGDDQINWFMSVALKDGKLFVPAPLTPPGDFYYAPLKTATYLYENTVPVFNIIYHHDLYIIPILGRMLALQASKKSLKVYSGTVGLLTLFDLKGNAKTIYLDARHDGIKTRPIPHLLYKIYYDEELKKGIAFVTINNPYQKFLVKDFPCRHLGKYFIRMDFFTTDRITRRTVYCRVEHLLKFVEGLPPIDVRNGILYLNVFDERFKEIQKKLPIGIPLI